MNWIILTLFRTLSWFMARVLKPRRAIALGRALGSFAFYCVPIRRRVVLNGLQRAFPEKSEAERWQIAHNCYRNLGRIFAETVFLPQLNAEEISRLVRLRNFELIDSILAQGKGLIFCMAHMGNWELIGFEGHRRGYDVYAVTKKLSGRVNELVHASRKMIFKELPPKDSFEQGVEVLQSGNKSTLALIIDQHRSGDKAVVVKFLGRPAATSPSPALFHLKTGAPVVTAWMTLGDDDVYDIWVRGPYPVPEAATLAERLQLHTQWLASDLEEFIRARPSEWYWVHRRWKVPDSTPVPQLDLKLESPPMPPLRTKDAA